MDTPRLSGHARERCAEMGISTKVAKRIVQYPSITHSTRDDRMLAISDLYPDYAVVYADEPMTGKTIITVLFNTQVRYTREGATWKELNE